MAYVVCQHLGVDTSGYSFGYVAGGAPGKGTPELKVHWTPYVLPRELIDGIEGRGGEQSPPKRTRQSSHRSSRKPKGKAVSVR